MLNGDLHGRFDELIRLQLQAKHYKLGIDLSIQVGDWGFYKQCFEVLDRHKLKFPIKTIAIPGNHDSQEFIKSSNHKEWEEKYNLFYRGLGYVDEIDGSIIAYMGKALNADRAQEGSVEDRTTNYILDVEVEETLEVFNKLPRIDLLITHSCPHSIGIGMVGSPYLIESVSKFCHDKGHSTGLITDCGEGSLRRLWHGLKVPVGQVAYGHFHTSRHARVGTTDFYCIGCSDCSDGSFQKHPFIYDTTTKKVEWRNDITLLNSTGFHSTRLR
jgi:hypothetical protein